jgi:hypothetical protein
VSEVASLRGSRCVAQLTPQCSGLTSDLRYVRFGLQPLTFAVRPFSISQDSASKFVGQGAMCPLSLTV